MTNLLMLVALPKDKQTSQNVWLCRNLGSLGIHANCRLLSRLGTQPTTNDCGNLGLSLAQGGKAGGGGSAVQGVVGIRDAFGTNLVIAANGIANQSDGRYGNYFTIHPYQTCRSWFGATSYAWDSAPVDQPNDVNARWVEFGREAYKACYDAAQ